MQRYFKEVKYLKEDILSFATNLKKFFKKHLEQPSQDCFAKLLVS